MLMELPAHTILDGSKIGSNNSRLFAVTVFWNRTIEPTGSVIRILHWVRMASLVTIVTSLEGHKIHYSRYIILRDLHRFSLPVGSLLHKNEATFEAPQMRVGTAAENKHLYWSHKITIQYKLH
jgi:hypothetical protein